MVEDAAAGTELIFRFQEVHLVPAEAVKQKTRQGFSYAPAGFGSTPHFP